MHYLTVLIVLIAGLSFAAPPTTPHHRNVDRSNPKVESNSTAFGQVQAVSSLKASLTTNIESPSTVAPIAAVETSSTPSPL